MARKRGKMALYEVMSKAKVKPDYGKTVEPLQPKKKPLKVPVVEEPVEQEPKVTTKWPKKPRIVQYNSGRIEFSIPYQLAITVGLALILMLLVTYKLGMNSSPANQEPTESAGNIQGSNREGPIGLSNSGNIQPDERETATSRPPNNQNREVATEGSTGGNVIVLAYHKELDDLLPVQEYFKQNLIYTEFDKSGDRYLLQTVDSFERDPQIPGTKGYELLQKIIEIGKNYKAPPGKETFAAHLFSDAYGRNVEKQ